LAPVMLDANVLQPPGAQVQAVERMLQLNHDGELDCAFAGSAAAEVLDPDAPVEVRRRIQEVRFASVPPPSVEDERLSVRVRTLLQGNAAEGRHRKDAANLIEAYRHGPYFVTNDKRMLKLREDLAAIMPRLRVLKPSELLLAYDAWVARDDDWRTI
jgi:hypothetical protein